MSTLANDIENAIERGIATGIREYFEKNQPQDTRITANVIVTRKDGTKLSHIGKFYGLPVVGSCLECFWSRDAFSERVSVETRVSLVSFRGEDYKNPYSYSSDEEYDTTIYANEQ